MMIQVINRPILEALKGSAAVGVFQANYRLGIFMMLLVSMFDFAWRPFFLTHAADSDAKPLFARVLTYVVLVLHAGLPPAELLPGRSSCAPRSSRAGRSSRPPYWSGLEIVPVILLAYLFLGVYNNLVAGIYIEKKTAYLPVITFGAAAVNVAANYLLIPVTRAHGRGDWQRSQLCGHGRHDLRRWSSGSILSPYEMGEDRRRSPSAALAVYLPWRWLPERRSARRGRRRCLPASLR